MAAVALTVSKLSPNADTTFGNTKVKFRTIATDTGDYVNDGIPLSASSCGLKRFHAVLPLGPMFDNAGADQYDLANPVSVRFNTERTTAYLMLFEAAGDGDALDQKPAEAMQVSSLSIVAIGH